MRMEKKKKKNSGITLIALVVTIVVTIIIASITLGTLLGDNGIIKNSQSSKETAEQQSERIAVEQATTAAMTQDRYGKLEESIFKEELDNATEGAKTNTYDDIFSVIVTFEDTKRAYEVDTETGEVTPIPYPYENVGISLSYSLEKDGKTWLQDGSEWTNDNVVVTVNFDESNSEYNDWTENKKIMYRLEKDTEWKEYNDSSKIVSERNQEVYVKVQGDENRTKVVEGETKYIDKIKPIIREIEKAGTEIEIKATDEASGVIGYAITTTNTPPSTFTSCTNTKELTEVISTANIYGRNYYLWVKDAAGNIGSNEDIITGNLPSSDLITITHKPTEWTNGNVIATASSEVTGLDIQMSKDGIDWTTVKTLTVEQNGTVYARFWDGETGTSSKSHQITNIDKIVPVITVSPENAGASKSQNVTITTEDEGGSGLSSSNSYQYYLSTSNTSQEGGEWKDYTSGQAFTIGTGKTGIYYIHVKPVSDIFGNSSGTKVSGAFKFDNTAPVVSVNPSSASNVKSSNIIITTSDTGGANLNGGNSYQYYLSSSSNSLSGGSWTPYNSGQSFTIGTGFNGTYYLFTKQIVDNASNISNKNGTIVTIGGTNYHRFGPYVFENLGIYVALNGNTLGFFNTEQKARAYADSTAHYYGNIEGSSYNNGNEVPWSSIAQNVKTVNIVDNIIPTSTSYWFYNFENLTSINNIANLNTSRVTKMNEMFNKCSSLVSLDLRTFNTGNVTSMINMFCDCRGLTSLDVTSFDTSKVTDMTSLFFQCYNLRTLNVSNWNTSNVKTMLNMFYLCQNLGSTLDLSSWNTRNVTNMSYMFSHDTNLRTVYIGPNWSTSQASTSYMTTNCPASFVRK